MCAVVVETGRGAEGVTAMEAATVPVEEGKVAVDSVAAVRAVMVEMVEMKVDMPMAMMASMMAMGGGQGMM